MPELRKRICCAKYKKKVKYKPLWTSPWIYCSKTASTIAFSDDGERVAFFCKVHRETTNINWKEIDPAELTAEETQGWKLVLEKFLEHCCERIEAWNSWREETIEKLSEINSASAEVAAVVQELKGKH